MIIIVIAAETDLSQHGISIIDRTRYPTLVCSVKHIVIYCIISLFSLPGIL